MTDTALHSLPLVVDESHKIEKAQRPAPHPDRQLVDTYTALRALKKRRGLLPQEQALLDRLRFRLGRPPG